MTCRCTIGVSGSVLLFVCVEDACTRIIYHGYALGPVLLSICFLFFFLLIKVQLLLEHFHPQELMDKTEAVFCCQVIFLGVN